jgi:single-stranded-DNA-specific exonuclease
MTTPHSVVWRIPEPTSPIAARAAARTFGLGHPLVAQLLMRRGLVGEELALYLSPDLARLEDPAKIRNMEAAVRVMDEAIRSGRKITIYGDYDVDGTTSTALLLSYLRSKGADPSFFIPQRSEGYGLTRESIDKIIAEHLPELLITVDCGTSSRREIDYARTRGLEVLVTDHHLPSPGKQANGIVVNPHLDPSGDMNRGLAGVGVAYKLVAAHFGRQPVANLDLVAMGTIADVMPLLDVRIADEDGVWHLDTPANENRILVRAGLDRLAHTRRLGLAALLATSVKPIPCPHGGRDCMVCGPGSCSHSTPMCYAASAEDIAYQVGPRINAVSRMGLDPRLVVDLLTTEDAGQAKEIADLLDSTNKERRELTNRLVDEAIAKVNPDEPIILVQLDLFKGVAGLVAGRLASEFGRPAIVVDLEGYGSARSVAGVPLLDVLQGELSSYAGADGHQMAMGIRGVRDLEGLRTKLNEHDWPAGLGTELAIDAVCTLADFDRGLLSALSRLEPTGAGNPAPLFAVGGVTIIGRRFMGADNRHVKLTLRDAAGTVRQAIWFSGGPKAPAEGTMIDIAGRPMLNTHPGTGETSVELHVSAVRAAGAVLAPTLGA